MRPRYASASPTNEEPGRYVMTDTRPGEIPTYVLRKLDIHSSFIDDISVLFFRRLVSQEPEISSHSSFSISVSSTKRGSQSN